MYRLDQEQQQSLESFRPIAESAIAPHAARVDRDGVFPHEAIAALGAAGLLGLTVPKAFGGKEQNARMAAALLDEAVRDLVLLLDRVGVDLITDGELRRDNFYRSSPASGAASAC